MTSAAAIAVSGIRAASLRLEAAASNIARAPVVGGVVLGVNQTDVAGGGTKASLTATPKPSAGQEPFNPAARAAEAWSFRANPYLSLTNEMVQVLLARFDLTANAHVLKADFEMSASLLGAKAYGQS